MVDPLPSRLSTSTPTSLPIRPMDFPCGRARNFLNSSEPSLRAIRRNPRLRPSSVPRFPPQKRWHMFRPRNRRPQASLASVLRRHGDAIHEQRWSRLASAGTVSSPKPESIISPTSETAGRSANFLFDELKTRIASGPIAFQVLVQLADGEDVVRSTRPFTGPRKEPCRISDGSF